MSHIKDNTALARVRLKPPRAIPEEHPVARAHNRIGGLIARLAEVTGLDADAALAIWAVESASVPFIRGRPLLRFENHVFFNRWGKDNEELFDAHFQFGGRGGIAGARWEQHRFRLGAGDDWRRFHGDQILEYQAFRLAIRLGGREIASQCASFGGPQIMGFNHATVGHASALDLFHAFARSERWQVFALFDFCQSKDLIGTIRARDWHGFATVYNGPGNAEAYAAKISDAFEMSRHIRGEHQEPVRLQQAT